MDSLALNTLVENATLTDESGTLEPLRPPHDPRINIDKDVFEYCRRLMNVKSLSFRALQGRQGFDPRITSERPWLTNGHACC